MNQLTAQHQRMPNALAVVVHGNFSDLSAAVARRIAQASAQAIAERGAFSIALAGGGTPRLCYELLRGMPVDWKHVRFWFGDERCLPRGDAGRNDTMAHEALLDHAAIPAGNIHPISSELGARVAASEYAKELKGELPLDMVLLGMGEDGHTASLFPGNPATEQDGIAVPVFDAPKPPAERVSLGMATLNSARAKMFLVAGKAKRDAMWQIMRGMLLPAARVSGAEWHIDRAALPDEFVSHQGRTECRSE